jgi:hypothetical protein
LSFKFFWKAVHTEVLLSFWGSFKWVFIAFNKCMVTAHQFPWQSNIGAICEAEKAFQRGSQMEMTSKARSQGETIPDPNYLWKRHKSPISRIY